MSRPLAIVLALALGLVALFIGLAALSYSANQIGGASPAGSNLMGLAGAYSAYGTIRLWGIAAFLIPVILAGWAWSLWQDHETADPARRLVGSLLLIPAVAGLVHLLPANTWESRLIAWDQLQDQGLGGAVGRFLCGAATRMTQPEFAGGLLTRHLDAAGAALILVAIGVTGLVLMDLGIGRWFRLLVRSLKNARGGDESAQHISTKPFVPRAQAAAKRRATTSIHAVAKRMENVDRGRVTVPDDVEHLVAKIRAHLKDPDAPVQPIVEDDASALSRASVTADPLPDTPTHEVPAAAAEPWDPPAQAPAPKTAGVQAQPSKAIQAIQPTVRRPAPAPRPKTSGEDPYELPPVTLLDVQPQRREAEHELEKQQTTKAIETAFNGFNIDVEVVGATRGPVVTQYEMRLLDEGMRVNKVEGYEKDLAMKLGTGGIRIVAPLPDKTTIGVEVPNKVKAAVVMRELVEEADCASMALPVIIGRDAIGRPMVADLAKAPHLLVAGATGMGKSVCMNAMICSILLYKGPEEVKFIMIDPKMVELAGYEGIPHLLTPPITDMTKAHAALDWACKTMDERYESLKATGVRDLASYNALGEDEIRFRLAKRGIKLEDLAHGKARMEYIVVLVDEYADLMMVNKEVEKSIVRLAAKSRACGIHVILTTQRPSADVVTGLIKSNLPSRICFRVVDKNNSRVVLDVSGAENLLGKGDLLFLQPGTSFPTRGQGVWLKDSEITAIVDHARSQGTPEYDESIVAVGAVATMDGSDPGGSSGGGGGSGGGNNGGDWIRDRSLHEAVQAMYRHDKTGADFLRRKMNIGYNRATAIIEQLEDLGVVGPQKSSASRDLLMSWDDWIDLLKKHGGSWEEGDEIYLNPLVVG